MQLAFKLYHKYHNFTEFGIVDIAFAITAFYFSGFSILTTSNQISSFSGQCSKPYAKIFLEFSSFPSCSSILAAAIHLILKKKTQEHF